MDKDDVTAAAIVGSLVVLLAGAQMYTASRDRAEDAAIQLFGRQEAAWAKARQAQIDQTQAQEAAQRSQDTDLHFKRQFLQDALDQWDIVYEHGHRQDWCVQARVVANAYLQLGQAQGYQEFTDKAQIFCGG